MDGGGGRREELGGVTLASVLEKDKDRSLRVNRTLLDIIRQEEPNCRVYDNIIDSHHGSKKGWKIFKDKRRLMRGGYGWAAEVSVPVSDVALGDDMVSTSEASGMDTVNVDNQRPALAQLLRARSVRIVEQVQEDDVSGEVQSLNHYLSRLGSPRENDADQENTSHIEHVPVPAVSSMRLSEALAAEREHTQTAMSSINAEGTETNSPNEEQVQIDAEDTNEEPQVRMSLMDLLEDTDSRQIGWSSSYYSADVEYNTENIDEVNEVVEEEGNNIVEQNCCCVCMVRHKGSAFIPCGHTFCRLCSREIWVNRGNCPICNGFILEILDIF